MSLTIRLSTTMSEEEIAPHGKEITACLKRFTDRFPEDATLASAWGDIVSGRRQLWLIQDETGRVVMVQVTEIVANALTGKTFVRCINTGGAEIVEALPLLEEIENWARSVGATSMEGVGREAWVRLLKPRGYRLKSVTLVKDL